MCLGICLCACMCMSLCMSVCMYVYMSLCMSVCMYVLLLCDVANGVNDNVASTREEYAMVTHELIKILESQCPSIVAT